MPGSPMRCLGFLVGEASQGACIPAHRLDTPLGQEMPNPYRADSLCLFPDIVAGKLHRGCT